MANRTFTRGVLTAGLAAALSLAAATAGSAASYYGYGYGYYDYAPGSLLIPGRNDEYQSRDGGPFGPPDPASCGGYSC